MIDNEKGINVLSLFDGISCGQLALHRSGIKVDNYFASEIDKHAIKVTQKNYPKTIQLGDVTKIKAKDLPKIDLLCGGSPCQGFSFAGKQLNFDDPRSKLFFEFVRLKNELNPKYFLLENVKMKKEYQDVITEHLGVEPIEINSSLVSAQKRKRLYWTNIPNIQQPNDKRIYLKDIIEYGYYNNEETNDGLVLIKINEKVKVRKYPVDIIKLKELLIQSKIKAKLTIKEIANKLNKPITMVEHWFRNDKSFSIPSEDIWFELKGLLNITTNDFDNSITEFEIKDGNFDMSKRVYKINGKSPTLTTVSGGQQRKIMDNNYQIRELTPIECERLQTLPDNYTEGVSKVQRYKMIGNGWTVDIIAELLKKIKNI